MKRRQSDVDAQSASRMDISASLHDLIRDPNNPRRDAAIHYTKDGLLFFNMICMHIRMAMESKHGLPDSFDDIIKKTIILRDKNESNDNLDFKLASDIYDTQWAEENKLDEIFGSSSTHSVIFGKNETH